MKYTLITGASKGLGKAFAYDCAKRGMNLLLVARSSHLLEPLAADLKQKHAIEVHTFSCDLLDHVAYRKIFDWVKENGFAVNMLVNNAGMGFYGQFDEQPLDKHLQVMHLNMDAMVKVAHEFLVSTDAAQQRYILNVVSMGGFLPVPYMAIYAASKAFMLSFSKSLRYELKQKKVNVTALCPGGVDTEFFGPAQMETIAKKTANLMMTAEEVAKEGIDALLANKMEVVPGFTNKIGAFASKMAPDSLVISQAGRLYKP
ncbi:MAG: SDR family oxidoreductase [Chitinophagales bacterium]